MTVADLIEALKELPQELPVYYDADYGVHSVEEVTLDYLSKHPIVLLT